MRYALLISKEARDQLQALPDSYAWIASLGVEIDGSFV